MHARTNLGKAAVALAALVFALAGAAIVFVARERKSDPTGAGTGRGQRQQQQRQLQLNTAGLLAASRVRLQLPTYSPEQIDQLLACMKEKLGAKWTPAYGEEIKSTIKGYYDQLAQLTVLDASAASFVKYEGGKVTTFFLEGGLSLLKKKDDGTTENLGGMHQKTQPVPPALQELLVQLLVTKFGLSQEQAQALVPSEVNYYILDTVHDSLKLAAPADYLWESPDATWGPALGARSVKFWGDHPFSSPKLLSWYGQDLSFKWSRSASEGDPSAKLKVVVAALDAAKLKELIESGQLPTGEGVFYGETDNNGQFTLPADQLAKMISPNAKVAGLAAFFTSVNKAQYTESPATYHYATNTDVVVTFVANPANWGAYPNAQKVLEAAKACQPK